MNETIEDVKPVRWNRRRKVVTGFVGGGIVAAAIFFTPKYGLVNRWDKEGSVHQVTRDYNSALDSLGIKVDSAGEIPEEVLAYVDSVNAETAKKVAENYKDNIDTLIAKSERERKALEEKYRGELSVALRSSLKEFTSGHPDFNLDRDYHLDNSYLGSTFRKEARDIGGYFALRTRLEGVLRGVEDMTAIRGRVLSGRTVLRVMNEKEASRYNPLTVMDPGYWAFEFDSNGNVKGLGRKLDYYPLGGKNE